MIDSLEPTMTHPQTAWLIPLVPVALTIAALIVVVFVLRAPLQQAITRMQVRRAAKARQALPAALVPDTALLWAPQTVPPARFLAISASVAIGIVLILSVIAPLFVALILTIPVTALAVWAITLIFEQRYTAQLNQELTPAVGRFSAMLASGNSFRTALDKILIDLPDGPVAHEWRFLLEHQGVPLQQSQGIATASQVVAALAAQTPSSRHATFLNHLTVAVSQPQDVLVARVKSAYDALQASDRRQEEAVTELAQMRYSGMAVGLAGLFMALYLVWTQWARVLVAYSTPLGVVVGIIVMFSLFLPIVGGMLLARADDVEY